MISITLKFIVLLGLDLILDFVEERPSPLSGSWKYLQITRINIEDCLTQDSQLQTTEPVTTNLSKSKVYSNNVNKEAQFPRGSDNKLGDHTTRNCSESHHWAVAMENQYLFHLGQLPQLITPAQGTGHLH